MTRRLTLHTPEGARLPAETAVLRGDLLAGAAVDRLAAYEDIAPALEQRQTQLAEKLAQLRGAGKERSVQFRELLAEKLTNASMLALLKTRGLY